MSFKIWSRSQIGSLFGSNSFRAFALAVAFTMVSTVEASNVGNVTQVPTVDYIHTHDLSRSPNIRLAGFVNDTDGGGGSFTLGTAGCTDDGGVVIKDSANNCFYRQFSGAVSLKWFGAPDATSTAWVGASGTLNCITNRQSCDSSALATKALAAALLYGNGEVTTDQRSVVFWSNVDLPANTKLTCGTQHGGPLLISTDGYWEQKGSIVLKVSGSSYSSIRQDENTELSGCAYIIPSWLIPGWYNDAAVTTPEPMPTIRSLTAAMRLRLGTAIISEGASANTRELTVVGFNICQDISAAPRAVTDQFYGECNILHYNHDQETGASLTNAANGVYLIYRGLQGCWAWTGATCTQTGSVQRATIPITGMANASGEIQVTTSNSSVYIQPPNFSVGDRILVRIGDSKLQLEADPPAQLAEGSPILLNVGLLPDGGGIDSTVEYIEVGDNVYDRNSPNCIPDDTTVSVVADNADGSRTVTLDKNVVTSGGDCNVTFRNIVFESESTAPPGAGGLHIIKSIVGNNIVLLGTSWAGPNYTSSWVSGASAIAVFDTTNIRAGQYIVKTTCAAPPYCPQADLVTGWAFAPSTVTDALNDTYTGAITVGSNANWPATGTVLIGTEEMTYRMASSGSSTSLVILKRAARGTIAASHSPGATITAAAPIVAAVIASPRPDEVPSYIVVGGSGIEAQAANAIASGSGTVWFANSTRITSGIVGSINVALDYKYWSASAVAGPVPQDVLQTTVSGTTTTLTVAHGCHKIFRGMSVRTSDGSAGFANNTVVTNDPTTCSVTISPAVTTPLTDESVIFDGCGFPSAVTAWAGNCTGVSVLLTAAAIDDNEGGVQGWVGTRISVASDRVSFKFDASPALTCNNLISAGGGRSGQQFDPASISFWFDRISDAAQCTTSMAKGHFIGILNTASKANDGIVLDNFLAGPVQVAVANMGINSNITITAMHTKDLSRIFLYSEAETQVLGDNDIPNIEIVTDDPASWQTDSATRSIFCGNNVLRDGTVCSSNGEGTLATVASISRLRLGDFSQQAQIVILKGYNTAGDGGGGVFTLGEAGCTDDSGTVIKTLAGLCYEREYETLSVEMFGTVACNDGDCANNNTSAFNLAFAAALTQRKREVRLNGGALGSRYYVANLDIPQDLSLVCPYGIASQGEAANEYTGNFNTTPYTILVPPDTMTMAGNTRLSGCTVMQTGLAIPANGPTTTAHLYTTSANMTGLGIELVGRKATVSNVQVIGFHTGIAMDDADQTDLRLENLTIDSHRCIYLKGVRLGNAQVSNVRCNPIPRAMDITTQTWSISAMANNGSGNYRLTLKDTCVTADGNCPQVGQTIWVSEPTGGSGTIGRWPVTAVGTSGANTTTIDVPVPLTQPGNWTGTTVSGSPLVTTLASTTTTTTVTGAVVGTIEGPSWSGRVHLTVGSTTGIVDGQYVCVFNVVGTVEANGCFIADVIDGNEIELANSVFINNYTSGGTLTFGYPVPGQNISGTGIPASSYVKAIWPRYNTLLLSANATAAGTATALTITNQTFGLTITNVAACASDGTKACLTVTEGTRDIVNDLNNLTVAGLTGGGACSTNGAHNHVKIESTTQIKLDVGVDGDCGTTGTAYSGYIYMIGTYRRSDGLYLRDTNNVLVNNFSAYQHENGIVFDDGVAFSSVTGIDLNAQNAGWDRLWCGLKFRVQAKGNSVSSGSIQVGPGHICGDFQAGSTIALNNVGPLALGGQEHAGPYATLFRIGGEKAAMMFSTLSGTGTGRAFIGGGAGQRFRLSNIVLPSVELYFEGSAQEQATQGTANLFSNSQPNKTTFGDCTNNISRTTLTMPLFNCGWMGMATAEYSADGLPAQDQANSTPLTTPLSIITEVLIAGDGVSLSREADGTGQCFTVVNDSANAVQVYSKIGDANDKINQAATATGVSLAAGKTGIYCTPKANFWFGGALG